MFMVGCGACSMITTLVILSLNQKIKNKTNFCYSKAFFQKISLVISSVETRCDFMKQLRSECSRFSPHFSLSMHILRQLGREDNPDFVVLWKNRSFVRVFLSAARRSDKNKYAHDTELRIAIFSINHQQ